MLSQPQIYENYIILIAASLSFTDPFNNLYIIKKIPVNTVDNAPLPLNFKSIDNNSIFYSKSLSYFYGAFFFYC